MAAFHGSDGVIKVGSGSAPIDQIQSCARAAGIPHESWNDLGEVSTVYSDQGGLSLVHVPPPLWGPRRWRAAVRAGDAAR